MRQGFSEGRAVDLKPPTHWFQKVPRADNRSLDLRENVPTGWSKRFPRARRCEPRLPPLAADMGGMGFIENNNVLCMLSVTINAHLLVAVLERSPRASERAGCQWFCTSPFGTKSQCLKGLPRHYAPSRSTKTWWTSVPICSCTAASTVSKFFSKSASTSSTRPGNVRLSMRPFSPSESDR